MLKVSASLPLLLLLSLTTESVSGFVRLRRQSSAQQSSAQQGSAQQGSFQPPNPDAAPCPELPIVKDFQADKYLGRWYEIQRFFAPFQSGSCVTADYSLLTNCSIGVINSQQLANGTVDVNSGSATSAGDPTKASLTVTFPGEAPPSEGNYNVLATDYTNYAVVYSCSVVNFGGEDTKFELSWVLTRRPRVNKVFLERLNQWLAKLGVETERYQPTRQTGCQYSLV